MNNHTKQSQLETLCEERLNSLINIELQSGKRNNHRISRELHDQLRLYFFEWKIRSDRKGGKR